MGLWDKMRGELVDIIEWLDDSRDTIVWRFPRYQNEIKMGAKLIVRESQVAIFVTEGRVADVFTPGTYTLETRNLPILSTLQGWKHGFESPWKSEVYFVAMRQFTDLKWGTQNPVIVRDAEFGVVRLRAFGGFAVRVANAELLLKELVGTDPQFRTEEVLAFLRQLVATHLGSALATAGVPLLDLAAQQLSIGTKLAGVLSAELSGYGIEVPAFLIENISVPPEVEAALDRRTSMGVAGDLGRYTTFQAAESMRDAANNPGGSSEGFGLGLGMAAAQQAGAAMNRPTPPPLPGTAADWFVGVDGQQQGPFDVAGLTGKVTRETLVWRAGLAAWVPAGQVPELASLFAATPPPLPPQA
ncbi:SPFH domain-containing protein [Catenuloplanes sp. NPDC051500]|uniref:SPFH domain-containing protein n=1 Tax=Catenuloplanes sp. NPDC051500 TaxID=3363959 RepID=UPI0037BA947F